MALRIEYRPASLSFDDFHRVDVECFPDEPIGPEALPKFLAQDFWAAYDSDSLAGFGYLIRKPDVAWLSRIGIAAGHRRRGIGTQLVRTMVEHCQRIGLPDMILYVLSDNDAALGLYDRFGFKPAESAYQFVLSNPQHLPLRSSDGSIKAVPIVELPKSSWPQFPREWVDIAGTHKPPEQYVLVFRDASSHNRGYCRLDPRFPGCFPFVVDRPLENLLPILRALHDYLLPDKNMLKLTFSADDLADACTALGLRLNYRLLKMFRSGVQSQGTLDTRLNRW